MAKKFVCPHCGCDTYATIASGSRSRCCGRKVVRVNGGVYANREDAPEWQVIEHFVSCKQEFGGLPRFAIPFGSSSYREAVSAAGMLLDKCDGDVGLSLAAIDVCFKDPNYRWMDATTLWVVGSGRLWPDIKARAEIRVETQKALEDRDSYFATTSSFVTPTIGVGNYR